MHHIQIARFALVLTGAAIVAQGALAGGERKNEQPFTRQAPRTVAAATNAGAIDVRGEPKNQLPFTRRMAR
jgi:hypothetical protein